jgi:hypothetical protein
MMNIQIYFYAPICLVSKLDDSIPMINKNVQLDTICSIINDTVFITGTRYYDRIPGRDTYNTNRCNVILDHQYLYNVMPNINLDDAIGQRLTEIIELDKKIHVYMDILNSNEITSDSETVTYLTTLYNLLEEIDSIQKAFAGSLSKQFTEVVPALDNTSFADPKDAAKAFTDARDNIAKAGPQDGYQERQLQEIRIPWEIENTIGPTGSGPGATFKQPNGTTIDSTKYYYDLYKMYRNPNYKSIDQFFSRNADRLDDIWKLFYGKKMARGEVEWNKFRYISLANKINTATGRQQNILPLNLITVDDSSDPVTVSKDDIINYVT